MALNTATVNSELINLLFTRFPMFVVNPRLFHNNTDVFEADEIHQKLYERYFKRNLYEDGDTSQEQFT